MRDGVVLFLSGLLISGASFAALTYAFRPAVTSSEDMLPKSVNLRAECTNGSELPLYLYVKKPQVLQSEVSAVLRIEGINRCARFLFRVTKPVFAVYLVSSEPVEAESAEDARRELEKRRRQVPPQRVGDLFDNYDVASVGLGDAWALEIDGAFVGNRISFDSYRFTGALAASSGSWKFEIVPDAKYQVLSGDTSFQFSAAPPGNGARRPLSFSLKFVEIDSLREVFAVVVSTILGVGLSTLVEGVAAMTRNRS